MKVKDIRKQEWIDIRVNKYNGKEIREKEKYRSLCPLCWKPLSYCRQGTNVTETDFVHNPREGADTKETQNGK